MNLHENFKKINEQADDELRIFCVSVILAIITFFLILLIGFAYEGTIFAKDPPMTTYRYRVFYIDGGSEIVSYKLHKGSTPSVETYKGSYWVDWTYPNKTIFGGIGQGYDGRVNGIVRIKKVK